MVCAENELTQMIQMRRPTARVAACGRAEIANDEERVNEAELRKEEDEGFANILFWELQESLVQFMASYTGIVIGNDAYSGWKKPCPNKCKKTHKQ